MGAAAERSERCDGVMSLPPPTTNRTCDNVHALHVIKRKIFGTITPFAFKKKGGRGVCVSGCGESEGGKEGCFPDLCWVLNKVHGLVLGAEELRDDVEGKREE